MHQGIVISIVHIDTAEETMKCCCSCPTIDRVQQVALAHVRDLRDCHYNEIKIIWRLSTYTIIMSIYILYINHHQHSAYVIYIEQSHVQDSSSIIIHVDDNFHQTIQW